MQLVDRMNYPPDDPTPFPLRERVLEALIDEIRRYLAVGHVFRAEGCEPRWA